MRNIKFRAWDKEKKRMLPITLMDFNEWWVSCKPVLEQKVTPEEYGERNSFKNEDTDRHILMQCTGLKDNKGKEIWEGDILLDEDSNWGYGGNYDKINDGKIRTLVPNIEDLLDEYSNIESDYFKYAEVIGNIYENPQLMIELQ